MNKRIQIVGLLMLINSFLFAQLDIERPIKTGKHKVLIRLLGASKKLKGYPISITDSGLWMTRSFVRRTTFKGMKDYELMFINADDIDKIYYRRNGTIGWGVFGGLFSGIVIGAASVPQNSNSTFGNIGSGLATVGAVITGIYAGSIVGGVVAGRIRKRFSIRGNQETFLNNRNSMIRYLPQQ